MRSMQYPLDAWTLSDDVTRGVDSYYPSNFVTVQVKKTLSEESASLDAMMPVFWVAKFFGVLPLTMKGKKIRFSWFTFPAVYWIVVTIIQGLYCCLSVVAIVVDTADNRGKWMTIVQISSFYFLGFFGNLLLLKLARHFPALMTAYAYVERRLGEEAIPKVKTKVFLLAFFVLLSATGETTTSMFYNVPANDSANTLEFLRKYTLRSHPNLIRFVGYTPFWGILLLLVNKFATFVWNYLDVILSVTAITLTALVRGLNYHIDKACQGGNKWNDGQWAYVRLLHMDVYNLIDEVNKIFGALVIQSYATNLTFILLQVYNGLKKLMSLEQKDHNTMLDSIYLAWSFFHLFGRLIIVSFTCSNVHEMSNISLPSLLAADRQGSTKDIRRLIRQIQGLNFGLTGAGYFLINKNFFVAITGALLTYEVILLQLNPSAYEK